MTITARLNPGLAGGGRSDSLNQYAARLYERAFPLVAIVEIQPVDKNVRGLAWVVVGWARKRRPEVILLENVEEFSTWGPLLADGTLLTQVIDERFGAHPNTARRLDEIRAANG